MNALANELCSGILLVRTIATRRKSSKHFPLSFLILLLLSVLRFPHQQGCKEKPVPLAQVRRLLFCLFSLVDIDGITTRVVRLLLSGQNFKALLLLQHHNNMLSSIIHAQFWLIGFQNQIQLVGTNYSGMMAFRMAEMYPNFVKKVVISSSGVGFVSTSLDELLAKSNLSSILELMLPSSVKGMKVFLANVTYKAMWLLNFIFHDMFQVSLTHHHPLSQTWKIQLRKLVVSRLWTFLESSSSCTLGFSFFHFLNPKKTKYHSYMRIWVKKKNPQWPDVQTNLEAILNPKSFSEIENKSAERGPL